MKRERLENLVGAFALGVHDRMRDEMAAAAPDPSSAAALITLAQETGLTIRRLSEALRLSHPATVRVVDRLVAGGWVRRGEGGDGRSVAVELTGSGRRLVRRLRQARSQALGDITRGLSEEEAAGLERAIRKVLARLTTSVPAASALCRLCDEVACDLSVCPVQGAERRLKSPEP